MNPYKKIQKLEKEIAQLSNYNVQLETENKQLKEELKKEIETSKKYVTEYQNKIQLLDTKESEYYRLCNDIKQLKKEYEELMIYAKKSIQKVRLKTLFN